MAVDTTTKANYVNIVIDNKKEYVAHLKKTASEDFEDDEIPKLQINTRTQSYVPQEFYYDTEDNTIMISGSMEGEGGETYVGIEIPLSDEVLIDILQAGVKKLNKLKNVLETLG